MVNRRISYFMVFFMSMSVVCLFNTRPAQAENQFLLNSLTVESKSGENLGSSSSQSNMAGFFQAQKALVSHMLTQIGIPPESLPPEVQADLAKPQTTSVKALLAFSTGLDQMDKGDFVAAKASFAAATSLDPGFQLAAQLQVAMPDKPTSVAEVSASAEVTGDKKAKAILKKVAKAAKKESQQDKDNEEEGAVDSSGDTADNKEGDAGTEVSDADSGELDLGSASQEESRVVFEDSNAGKSFVETLPEESASSAFAEIEEVKNFATEGTTADEDVVDSTEKSTESAQDATTTQTVYTSSPACAGGLCGFYATLLGKSVDGSQHLVTTPYITTNAVALTTGGEAIIAQLGGGGFLKGDTSPAMANIKSFYEGSSGASGSSATSPIYLNGVVENESHGSYPSVAVGYYYTNNFGDYSNFVGLSSGGHDYSPYGNTVFFAEGVVTPSADLSTLAQNSTTYHYSGLAGGIMAIRESFTSDSGSSHSSSSGYGSYNSNNNFSADLNFSTGKVTNFDSTVSFDDNAQVKITAESATLNSNGSFSFTPGAASTSFQVTPPSYIGSEPVDMTKGLVTGRTFGPQAAAVGGVFTGQSTFVLPASAAISHSSTYEILTSGAFAGSRPADVDGGSGSTSGTVP